MQYIVQHGIVIGYNIGLAFSIRKGGQGIGIQGVMESWVCEVGGSIETWGRVRQTRPET